MRVMQGDIRRLQDTQAGIGLQLASHLATCSERHVMVLEFQRDTVKTLKSMKWLVIVGLVIGFGQIHIPLTDWVVWIKALL